MATEFMDITPAELKERIDKGDKLVLLDVREAHEIEISKLPDIVHIPMNEVPDRVHELDTADEIICICRSGGRSANVAGFLVNSGFQKVHNMVGGMNGYAQQVDQSIPVY